MAQRSKGSSITRQQLFALPHFTLVFPVILLYRKPTTVFQMRIQQLANFYCMKCSKALWVKEVCRDNQSTVETHSMNWIDRCLTLREFGLGVDFLGVLIAWLQRFQNAAIWQDSLTIVPIAIAYKISIMNSLFRKYNEAMMAPVDDGASELIFHPTIDLNRFMDATAPVISWILKSQVSLFEKPYIIFLANDLIASHWSCFIGICAGAIGTSSASTAYHACEHDDEVDIEESTFSFFLTLAYVVSHATDTPEIRDMDQFHTLFMNSKFNFGYDKSEKRRKNSFLGNGRISNENVLCGQRC